MPKGDALLLKASPFGVYLFCSPLFLIIHAPVQHCVENGLETFAQVGEAVLDTRRHFGVHFAVHEAIFFHGAQLLRQHFLRNAADGALELAEAFRAIHQIAQNEHLPFVADEQKRGLHWTWRQVFFIWHKASSPNGYFLVPTALYCAYFTNDRCSLIVSV